MAPMSVSLVKKLFGWFIAIAGGVLAMVGSYLIVTTSTARGLEAGILMLLVGGFAMIAWGMHAR